MPDAVATPPAPLSHSGEHTQIEVSTRVELIKIAYGELPSGTIASTATALVFAVVVAAQIGSKVPWVWLTAMLIIAVYRVWLIMGFRSVDPTPENCSRWAKRLVLASTTTGCGWGITTWIFPTILQGGPAGIVHVLFLAGVTTGSARMLLPMREASIAYLFAVMGPLCLRFFAEADLAGAALGGCTLFFIVYMAQATLRNNRAFADALILRFEKESLAAELTSQNARRELREAELRDARERAESASRAKGEFLATMSHEIRTPMNGVLGMLRVMKDTPLTAEQQAYVKTASDSAESLLLLLNDVLDFSKIEAGRLELEHAPYSPGATVNAVADLMLGRARDKGLQFEVRLSELPAVIVGDATRLRQILLNLLGNAIKFTERGGVELTATCLERTETSAILEFAVRDTGIGIDPVKLSRLFKPFSQLDTSMSRRHGGTGLGLAISQRIANAMSGSIQVETEPGRGSVFRLLLPAELPSGNRVPSLPVGPTFVTPSLSGRVLVVEDDAVNQQVIELFLKKMNLAPAFAADGEEAIAATAKEHFDVILMDCQLPGIDGLEATRRIRRQSTAPMPHIVALTANASTQVRDACLAAGMDDFLSKPVRFELLAELLKKNLPSG